MNTLRFSLMTEVARLIEGTELLLDSPRIQSRITVAAVARDWLIRQLFWAEQMLACLRDDVDYTVCQRNLHVASEASKKSVEAVQDFHNPKV